MENKPSYIQHRMFYSRGDVEKTLKICLFVIFLHGLFGLCCGGCGRLGIDDQKKIEVVQSIVPVAVKATFKFKTAGQR